MRFKEPIKAMQDRIDKLWSEINFLESLPVTEIRSRIIQGMRDEAMEFEEAIEHLQYNAAFAHGEEL